MKKIFYILKVTIALLLVFGAASCSKSDEGGSSLKLSKTELAFTSSVRTLTLTVTTNQEWTATSPEWLTCSPASGTAMPLSRSQPRRIPGRNAPEPSRLREEAKRK